MEFFDHFLKTCLANFGNNYNDNWDYLRFGKENSNFSNTLRGKLVSRFRKLINAKGYFDSRELQLFLNNNEGKIKTFEYLYSNLNSETDKDLLIKVLCYRVLGYKKVKLPLNTQSYWEKIDFIDSLANRNEVIETQFMNIKLHKYDLEKLGYPINLYFSSIGLMLIFEVKQYEYHQNNKNIKVEKGDVVIDCGGCWGDTALYFANEAGEKGKVFSYEFIPKNIEIYERNLLLNEKLKSIIQIVKHPVWSDSITKLFYKDNGPGSRVSNASGKDDDGSIMTKSIDDLVKENNLNKVDFIKMDIEGAELNALHGATETIKKYKPKLAISLYHSFEDFESIPKYLKKIVPEYNFFFSHVTIHNEESILFAKVI